MKRFLILALLAASAIAIGPAFAYTQTVRTDPELRLFLAEVPPECVRFGQTNDGTAIWLGDCVAPVAVTETPVPADTETAAPLPTNTNAPPSNTPRTRTATPTRTAGVIVTPTATLTPTVGLPSATPPIGPSPTPGSGNIAPYPSAPACVAHDFNEFHTLWNSALGCHYDHEHGQDPFIPSVANAFPGFNLRQLIGNVGVGHSNPSSPIENTDKHGGFKWDVTLAPVTKGSPCLGRENVATGVDALAVQYHGFGNYTIEFEARVHSAAFMLRQCRVGNPSDKGYIFVIQPQDYGQRTGPYQGFILPYPDTPLPAYDPAREPYMAIACFGNGTEDCARNPTLAGMVSGNQDTNTTWISEPGNISGGSPLAGLLFRARDTYQAWNSTDKTYPFDFRFLCSSDGGTTYNAAAANCRWNNSTTHIHEIMGNIPAAWDNATNFDTDPRPGRITAQAFVSAYGTLQGFCMPNDQACFPIKLVSAFTGNYGVGFDLVSPANSETSFSPAELPERDIYFCGNVVCAETAPGAKASGWIGPNN